MTVLYAYDQTDLLSLNLNFWYANLVFDEFNNDAFQDGYEDNYHIYTNTSDALSLYGYDFAYDGSDMSIGTIEALSQWAWVPDLSLVDEGYWSERWHWTGWDYDMQTFWNFGQTPDTTDDLVLIKDVMSGADTLYLSAFDDEMNGFEGADVIQGYDGFDILSGNQGADMLMGNVGQDWLHGGRGNDILNGGKGNDTLNGGDGKDDLSGQDGKDVLRGGGWRDTIAGGNGADRFVFKTGDDKDIILDFELGVDVVDLRGLKSVKSWDDLVNNHMEQDGADVVIDGLNGDEIVLRNTAIGDIDEGNFLF